MQEERADFAQAGPALDHALWARRPVGLDEGEVATLAGFVRARLGQRYDLKNVIDLARQLLPTPPGLPAAVNAGLRF